MIKYCEVCSSHVEVTGTGCARTCGMDHESDLDYGYESDCPYQNDDQVYPEFEDYDEEAHEIIEDYAEYADEDN